MRKGLLALALGASVLGGCAARTGTETATTSTPAARAGWSAFRDARVEELFRLDPAFAVYQGRHDLDGRLGDWSDAGLKRLGDFYRGAIAEAQAFSAAGLSSDERFERDYFVNTMEGRLFWLEDADQPHRNPQWYVNAGLDPNVYVAREYAAPEVRARALTAFLRQVPGGAANIRRNLAGPMPQSFVDFGVNAFSGFADYYSGDAVKAFAGVRDAQVQAELRAAAAGASAAMKELATWLESRRATATQDYALGAERFGRMLRATEAVDTPLDELEAAGRGDLQRNQAALTAACARFAPGATVPACMARMNARKAADGPVAEARRQAPMLKRFLIERDLVTIPDAEQALVEESPPYNRQNSAYIDVPGPYERGIPSIYYISPPDPSWTEQVRAAFVPGDKDLLFTTVHEVWPGHFLQFRHAVRSPSTFGRSFVGYAFAEGWAHYAEEMMLDAGLGGDDPEYRVGQLSNALLRNCRYLSAVGLHARGMTLDQSRRLFREQCFQDEGTARQQAARGTYDPAYLNYTLGKLMIRRLREDYVATRGGRRAWKAFHDRVLSFGGPPVPLVRRTMMAEASARAVF